MSAARMWLMAVGIAVLGSVAAQLVPVPTWPDPASPSDDPAPPVQSGRARRQARFQAERDQLLSSVQMALSVNASIQGRLDALDHIADLTMDLEHAQALSSMDLFRQLVGALTACLNTTPQTCSTSELSSLLKRQSRADGCDALAAQICIVLGSAAAYKPSIAAAVREAGALTPLVSLAFVAPQSRESTHRALYALNALVRHDDTSAVLVSADAAAVNALAALVYRRQHHTRALQMVETLAHLLPVRLCDQVAEAIVAGDSRGQAFQAALALIDHHGEVCCRKVMRPDVVAILQGHQCDIDDDHERAVIGRLLSRYEYDRNVTAFSQGMPI
ncbi:Nucleotide exchange factor SIL1 [Plasmodiophora brassicae]